MKSSFTLFPTPFHYHWPSTSTNNLGSCSDSISTKTFQLHFPLTHYTLYNLNSLPIPFSLPPFKPSLPSNSHSHFSHFHYNNLYNSQDSLSRRTPLYITHSRLPHVIAWRIEQPRQAAHQNQTLCNVFLHFPQTYSIFLLPRWPPYSSNLFSV